VPRSRWPTTLLKGDYLMPPAGQAESDAPGFLTLVS
jgi:hypothetical protein